MKREYKYLVGDFETTVYDSQDFTEVWASAIVEMYTEDVHIFHSISDTFEYLKSLNCHCIVYYHNLQFDGSFWAYYLIHDLRMKQADSEEGFPKDGKMKNNTFKYCINSMGKWYSMTIKVNGKLIELRDSLKLLPFSVKNMGKSFKTKHQKLEMEYTGYRWSGCRISEEEKQYIANDVLVVKECLEIMFDEGHNKLTIGSCCLKEYKELTTNLIYNEWFPDMSKYWLTTDSVKYRQISDKERIYEDADSYIRRSYRGGWCYVVKGCENKIYKHGLTCDVNSLYPSVMHSESGNEYPVGLPRFWVGDIPDEALQEHVYFFIRIKTKFKIKKGYLPFIQIKGSMLYKGNEYLETSDVYDSRDGCYYNGYYDVNGEFTEAKPILTLTCTDYWLMQKHYDLIDCEILDGCWFQTQLGIFDPYINKYRKIKMESKGAKRTSAKLFLNNLYGKMATNDDSSYKTMYIDEEGIMKYKTVIEHTKKVGYIPVGSAITSYARYFTITHAQKNYHTNMLTGRPFNKDGTHIKGFIYADTDSIHCDIGPEDLIDIKVHPNAFNCWKVESSWDEAVFVRQKTYIEHITQHDLENIDNPYYDVKCAGMGRRPKELFEMSLKGYYPNSEEISKFDEDELNFLKKKRKLTDFKRGLVVPSDLSPVKIRGGVLLVKQNYTMR